MVMKGNANNTIIGIISKQTGVPEEYVEKVINFYLKVQCDAAMRISAAPAQSSEKKYAMEIAAIKRKTATLSFEALYAPPKDDAHSFFETPSYDRVKVTLVDTKDPQNKKTPFANIPADDWDGIRERTRRCFYAGSNASVSDAPVPASEPAANPAKSTPAYTAQFAMGPFKGMTPARVLRESPELKDKLIKQKEIMAPYVEKYPNNALLIKAIDEAVALFDSGKLSNNGPAPAVAATGAYTECFVAGNYKGKTPAAVLLENPNAIPELKAQKDFLEKNLAKFPNNRKLMDAIDHAINLASTGTLDKERAEKQGNGDEIIVYESSLKPLESKRAPNGLVFVYKIMITYSSFKKGFPWKVAISNGYTNGERDENGKWTVGKGGNVTDKVGGIINLTDDEWFTVLRKIEQSYNHFYGEMFTTQYPVAQKYIEGKRRIAAEKRANKAYGQ